MTGEESYCQTPKLNLLHLRERAGCVAPPEARSADKCRAVIDMGFAMLTSHLETWWGTEWDPTARCALYYAHVNGVPSGCAPAEAGGTSPAGAGRWAWRAPCWCGAGPRHGQGGSPGTASPLAPGPGAAGAAAGGHPLPPSGCLRPSVPGKHLSGGYLFIYVFIFPHQAAILPQQAASEAVEAVRGRAPRPIVGPAMGALVCVLPDTAPGDMLGTRGHGPTPHSLRKRIPEAPIGGEIPPKSQPCSFCPGIKATLPRYPVGQGFSPFTCKDFGL